MSAGVEKTCWVLWQNKVLHAKGFNPENTLAVGGSISAFPRGSFINLLSVEKFDFTKTAQVIKIQLKKHKPKYSQFF